MKTKTQILREYPEYRILINAVINNIGMDSIRNVNKHGIDGGFSGFIYYSDTHKFAIQYRKQIISMLEDSASSLGEEVISMVNSFGVFRPDGMDSDDKRDLYKYLGGGRPDQGALTNVMAWFAAEEVCRLFEN